MKTTTKRIAGKRVIVAKRKRSKLKRYGVKRGPTFLGIHIGLWSHYVSIQGCTKPWHGADIR